MKSLVLSLLAILCLTPSLHAQNYAWQVSRDLFNAYPLSIGVAGRNDIMVQVTSGNIRSYVLKTTNGGESWFVVFKDVATSGHYPPHVNSIVHPTPDLALMTCDSGLIIRTSDGGKTWQRIQVHPPSSLLNGFPEETQISMFNEHEGLLAAIAGTRYGLFHTTDGGLTWDSITNFRPQGWDVQPVAAVACLSPRRFWCLFDSGVEGDMVALTTDAGKSWQYKPQVLSSNERKRYPLESVQFFDTLNGMGYTLMPGDSATNAWVILILRTRDGGLTWQPVYGPGVLDPRRTAYNSMHFRDTLNGVVGTDAYDMMRTHDGGKTWQRDSIAPYSTPIQSFRAVYAGPDWGIAAAFTGKILRYLPLASGVPVQRQEEAISDMLIFPNPVYSAGRVQIHFQLSKYDRVGARVCDRLGSTVLPETVQTLPAGEYTQMLNVGGLAAGSYFVRLATGNTQRLFPFTVLR